MQDDPKNFDELFNEKESVNHIDRRISSYRYFFADLDSMQSEDIKLVCAGRELCQSEYKISREYFIYYALEYLPEGEWTLTYNGVDYHMNGNTIFAYKPDTSYSLVSKNESDTRKYFIDFIGENAQKILLDSGIEFGKPIKVSQSTWINNIFSLILNCDTFPKDNAAEISTSLLNTIIQIIKADNDIKDFSKTNVSYQKFLECKAYVNENFLEIRDINDVVDNCCIESSYLSKLFSKYASASPMKFITRLKIRYATDLLINKNMTIKEVSSFMNFQDQYHFSKVFKRIMGVSPANYKMDIENKKTFNK